MPNLYWWLYRFSGNLGVRYASEYYGRMKLFRNWIRMHVLMRAIVRSEFKISKWKLIYCLGFGFLFPLFVRAQCPNNPVLDPIAWADGSGSATYSGGFYTISGTGNNSSSQYETGYADLTTLAGNGQIQAEITSIKGNVGSDTAVGIFIRRDKSQGADGGLLWIGGSGNSQYQFDTRINNGSLTELQSGSCSLPYWLRLQNSGGVLYPAVSKNGSTWTLLPVFDLSSEFNASITLAYGLMVWSGSDSKPTTGVFSNVCVNNSFSAYPTLTPTATGTPTPDPTPSRTTNPTPTHTPVPTQTKTATFTATSTFTPTGTFASPSTHTPTPLPTSTPPAGIKVWPNPFTPLLPTNNVTHFLLPANHGAGRLLIADLKRKLVRSFDFEAFAGVQWDGKDNGGNVVSSGLYLYLLESDGTVRRGTVTVMR